MRSFNVHIFRLITKATETDMCVAHPKQVRQACKNVVVNSKIQETIRRMK